MKRTQKLLSIVCVNAATLSVVLSASADVQDSTPSDGETVTFSAALWNPAQTSDETQSVRGLRLNLPYGKNRDVRGLDLGIANHVTGEVRGAQLGLVSYVAGDVTGIQYNHVASLAYGHMLGWQQGLFASASSLEGAQTGLVNVTEHEAWGSCSAASTWRESLSKASAWASSTTHRV